MSKRKKKIAFIRQNQALSVPELSSRTGLGESEIERILSDLKTEPPSGEPLENGGFFQQAWPWLLLLAAAVIGVYFPLSTNTFVNWDDGETITGNPLIRSLALPAVFRMFTSVHTGNWVPLTWLSFALDYAVGGLNPAVYLWNNLLLHLLNTFLVFFLARRIFSLAPDPKDPVGRSNGKDWVLPGAFLSALAFGIHPIHVESVAWASERKDVLYAFFYLLGLLTYLPYARGTGPSRKNLAKCLLLFLLALMAKPMAISFPAVLLILDFWPLQRNFLKKEVWLAKWIFLLPVLASAGLAVAAQRAAAATPNLAQFPLDQRLLNGIKGLAFYAYKLFIPDHFCAIYPVDLKASWTSPNALLSFLAVLVFSVCLVYWVKRVPSLAACWAYYVVTLAPVLGIVQIGSQSVADRYAYLPTLGFILLFSAASSFLLRGKGFVLFVAALGVFLGIKTHQQVGVWNNSKSLWKNAVQYTDPPSELPYWYLGFAFRDGGEPTEALAAFEKSISINPQLAVTHYGKALALEDLGRIDEALEEFKKSIALDPGYAQPHINLSSLYQKLGQYDAAVQEGEKAVSLDPTNAQAFNNLGVGYGYQGRLADAFQAFQQAVSLEPDNPMYQQNLESARKMLGK